MKKNAALFMALAIILAIFASVSAYGQQYADLSLTGASDGMDFAPPPSSLDEVEPVLLGVAPPEVGGFLRAGFSLRTSGARCCWKIL